MVERHRNPTNNRDLQLYMQGAIRHHTARMRHEVLLAHRRKAIADTGQTCMLLDKMQDKPAAFCTGPGH